MPATSTSLSSLLTKHIRVTASGGGGAMTKKGRAKVGWEDGVSLTPAC